MMDKEFRSLLDAIPRATHDSLLWVSSLALSHSRCSRASYLASFFCLAVRRFFQRTLKRFFRGDFDKFFNELRDMFFDGFFGRLLGELIGQPLLRICLETLI